MTREFIRRWYLRRTFLVVIAQSVYRGNVEREKVKIVRKREDVAILIMQKIVRGVGISVATNPYPSMSLVHMPTQKLLKTHTNPPETKFLSLAVPCTLQGMASPFPSVCNINPASVAGHRWKGTSRQNVARPRDHQDSSSFSRSSRSPQARNSNVKVATRRNRGPACFPGALRAQEA